MGADAGQTLECSSLAQLYPSQLPAAARRNSASKDNVIVASGRKDLAANIDSKQICVYAKQQHQTT